MSPGLILVLGLMAQDMAERPPRPSDDAMLAPLLEQRPGARVVSIDFHEPPRGGGRTACGLLDIEGTIEPFALLAAWQDSRPPVVIQHGAPRPSPEPAGWRLHNIAAERPDRNGDGVVDRGDRNGNTLSRKLALAVCDDLQPPQGVTWATEMEADPDPVRAARTRRQTDRLMGLIFGSQDQSPD
jgi:hypothetical protein